MTLLEARAENQTAKGAKELHQSVKAIIINENGEIFTFRRSHKEKIRRYALDIPGGGFEDGEDLIDAIIRETDEELPGTRLFNLWYLGSKRNRERGVEVASHLLAGLALFGIDDAGNKNIGQEHIGGSDLWVPLEDFVRLEDVPNKWQKLVARSPDIIGHLARQATEIANSRLDVLALLEESATGLVIPEFATAS